MKIAIVGCGLAGMSTYLALRKFLPGDHHVTIYESRTPPPDQDVKPSENLDTADVAAPQGGCIGIPANGMRTLHNLDPAVHAAIQERGYAYGTVRLRSSTGWDLTVKRRTRRGGDVTMMMARQAAWRTLREAIPDDHVVIRKVAKITKRGQSGNTKPVISFADGSSADFDLVIGADGVHSTVRKHLFSDHSVDVAAVFSKRCGIWGFIPMRIPEEVASTKSVVIVMGDNASMGYSAYRPTEDDSLTWWSLYDTDEPPSRKEVPREFVSAMLQDMYGDWEEENVRGVLQKASAPFIYPVWTVPELPTWGDGGVVLVGDAAHAMTPDIGQGTSQAFEDSEALGMLLGRALQEGGIAQDAAVDLAVRGLYECRLPRLSKIKLLNAQARSKGVRRNIWAQRLVFFCIWITSRFTWLHNLIYSNDREGEEIINGWDGDMETRKVVEKLLPLL
ncbi:Extracellular salicylate hydroxylase/monooxygenase [Colletotrichum higginsianum IMI 349063]|uniref:Extracellular salicylate hydroxylase/monooxygenase n=1 Tax=Colletotrichum higginsianum (strain IMI 349063) TaxID=759273 RepID=A0A1B7YLD3_COLHI|nr:Extracellular salicylate hydroxylase/monooxygenase [Colletotrichum higginsianum IMI 349063]OBR12849.1 Extracellular salicylate hydroxylase/monooxygenase [Colletotrichum higginsianum IMI 349063]